jgi:hypothetical protein
MPEADIKPFFPAASVVVNNGFLHTISGLGNNKAVTAFIAVICFLMAANLNAQTLDWVKTFGGIGDDFCESMVIDAVGNVYTVGGFQNTVDFNPGTDSMMLSSLGWRIFSFRNWMHKAISSGRKLSGEKVMILGGALLLMRRVMFIS